MLEGLGKLARRAFHIEGKEVDTSMLVLPGQETPVSLNTVELAARITQHSDEILRIQTQATTLEGVASDRLAERDNGEQVGNAFVDVATRAKTIRDEAHAASSRLLAEPDISALLEIGAGLNINDLQRIEIQRQFGGNELEYRAEAVQTLASTLAARHDAEYIRQIRTGNPVPTLPTRDFTAEAISLLDGLWGTFTPRDAVIVQESEGPQSAVHREEELVDATGNASRQGPEGTQAPEVEGATIAGAVLVDVDSPEAAGSVSRGGEGVHAPTVDDAARRTQKLGALILGVGAEALEPTITRLHFLQHQAALATAEQQSPTRPRQDSYTSIAHSVLARLAEERARVVNADTVLDLYLLLEKNLRNLMAIDPEMRNQIADKFLAQIQTLTQQRQARLDSIEEEGGQNQDAQLVQEVSRTREELALLQFLATQITAYAQPRADVDAILVAVHERIGKMPEDKVQNEAVGLKEGENHFESQMHITLPLEDEPLETNFFVGPHRYLQIGEQVARVTTGYDVSHRPSVWLTFGTYQQGIDPGVSFGDMILSESSRNIGPVEIDKTHSYTWHLERVGDVITSKDEAGKDTTEMNVKIVCDVTESSADGPEDLTEPHDSVISGPSSETDTPLGTHFGEQEDGWPDEQSPEQPPIPPAEESPVEKIVTIPELAHPGFERLEPRHTYTVEAHEDSLIEERKEEGIHVGENNVSWGIYQVNSKQAPHMWVLDVGVGGQAADFPLNMDGNQNMFEHGDFALVAIVQPAGSEPSRTWKIRAELLKRIPEDDTLQSRREVLMQNLARVQVTGIESTTADLAHLQSECNEILQQYRNRFLERGMSATEVEERSEVRDLIGFAKIISGLISARPSTRQEATSSALQQGLVDNPSAATQIPNNFTAFTENIAERGSTEAQKPTDASVGLQVGLRSFENREYESALDTFRRAWDHRSNLDASNGTDINIALRVLEAAEQVIGSRFARSQNVQAHINFINEFIPQMQCAYAEVVRSGELGDDLINRIHRLYNYPVTQYKHIDETLHLACIDAEIQCLQALDGDTDARAQRYSSSIDEKSRIEAGLATKKKEVAKAQFLQRLDVALTHIPDTLAAIREPVRTVYVLAYDVTKAELDIVTKVGEVAGSSHIPFLGPAFKGFAEFIQGTFTLRNLETGLITDKSREEARQHFVNWIVGSIEGGIDLAGLVSGDASALGSIRELLVKGETRNPLLPRLVSLMACQRIMGTSGAENPDITRTIGQIAAGLLQDPQFAEGIDADLRSDQRFTGFVDKLKEHLQRSPH